MVRECRPPAREPTRSWLARRSTMATSTPANASSPANISPVGPASGDHHCMLGHRHTPVASAAKIPSCAAIFTLGSTFSLEPKHRQENTHSCLPFGRFWFRGPIMEHGSGLAASLPVRHILEVAGRESSRFGAYSLWTEWPVRRIDLHPRIEPVSSVDLHRIAAHVQVSSVGER